MSAAIRLYPAIDIRDGRAVRLLRGDYERETAYDADPVDAARRWVDGGATSLENLLVLCDTHHRLVHEGGFTIERHRNGGYYFVRPDGRPLESASVETVRQSRAVYRVSGLKVSSG